MSIRSISTESLNSYTEFENERESNGNTENFGMEASSKGKVKGSMIGNYLTSGANWFFLFILGIFYVFVQFVAMAVDYFVSVWYVIHSLIGKYIETHPITFYFRVKQEESRTFRQNHNTTDNDNDSYDYPSFTLSTEQCTYIQGILIISLFVFGLSR